MIKKGINKFTGKEKYDDAVEKRESVRKRYEKKQKEYEAEREKIMQSIGEKVSEINNIKVNIHLALMADLVEKLSFLKDIEIPEELQEEVYKEQSKHISDFIEMKSRESLFQIDFDGHKVKIALQAIFTLGFYTRKKAKETYYKVEEEEAAINSAIKEMSNEIEKYNACLSSANNIEHYFREMARIFAKMLQYLNHALNYVGYTAMRLSKKLKKGSISVSVLPERQQKELEATITLAKTLSKLIRTKIIVQDDKNNLSEYEKEMGSSYNKMSADPIYR